MTIDEAIKESIKTGVEVTLPRSEDRMTAAADIQDLILESSEADSNEWSYGVLTFSGQGWKIRLVPWDSEELKGDSTRPGAVEYAVYNRHSEEGWLGYVLAVSPPDACRRFATKCAWEPSDLCAVDVDAAVAMCSVSKDSK